MTTYTVNDGNSGGNYNVSTNTASGTITKAALDISAVSDTKVYDGTTASSGTPTVGAGSSRARHRHRYGAGVPVQERARPGNSTLEVTTYTVNDGNSGGNYDVTTHTASGTINKASLDITAVSDTKVYDGQRARTARRR